MKTDFSFDSATELQAYVLFLIGLLTAAQQKAMHRSDSSRFLSAILLDSLNSVGALTFKH